MARRSRDWNEGLAADLRDPDFARAPLPPPRRRNAA